MSQTDSVWFKSKLDWWLAIILLVLPFIELAALMSAVRSGSREALMSTGIGVAVVVAIYGLLVIPVRYGVDAENLTIRFGVVRRRVALGLIREVHPSHNPLASPALSLDRLAIGLDGGGMALVSPADRDGFLDLIAARTGLARQGDTLAPSGS